jgi:outer membrane protein
MKRAFFRHLIAGACSVSLIAAQDRALVERPGGSVFVRPYKAPVASPVQLHNSNRLTSLIRDGKLYLTAQDTLALAIENNMGLELDRYGPELAEWAVQRAEGGGPLRGVQSGTSQVSSVLNGLGVNGSVASAGLATNNGGGGGGGGGGASVQQIGVVTPNLDPTLQSAGTFSHLSYPQSNTVLSQTPVLIQGVRTFSNVLQQGLITGGYVQLYEYEQHLQENSPSDVLNPAVGAHIDLYIQHNLLQGFGISLNDRGIRIAKKNTTAAQEVFRSQLIDLVAIVLNRYWDLVVANDELKTRQSALDITQKFYDDTKKQIEIGVAARVELPRAAAEVASRNQEVSIAQAVVLQQSTLLKNDLVRSMDPVVEAAEIVPVDRIAVPETDDLPPLRKLIASAMEDRPDVALAKIRDENAAINIVGTVNPLLPTLIGYARVSASGAAGTPQPSSGVQPNPSLVGGFGTALGQIFRHNYPTEYGGLYFSLPFRNRQSQGDYGIDQLQLVQSQVSGQRDTNQIAVDVSNYVSALRQTRARYGAAVNTRELQEQLLVAEQKKFSFGESTINDLITDQRSLVTAQISELTARAAYAHARVSLDQVLGQTLEKNHITLSEGLEGKVK